MEFTNSAIASRYAMNGADQTIHIAGLYYGLLSAVTVEAILDGMIARNSPLVSLKNGGGSGVVNSGGNYEFTGAAGQTVFPLPDDPDATAIRNALKSTKLLIVALEGTMLTRGTGSDQYTYNPATGIITFHQTITNLKASINFFK